MKNKRSVLFVGAFNLSGKSEVLGGQLFACTSLYNSYLKHNFNWILIDTISTSNLERKLSSKIYNSLLRFIRFFYILTTKNVDTVLIFCSNGFSFYEKGLMCIIAKRVFNKKVILAPRSGRLKDEIINQTIFFRKIFESVDIIICQSQLWKEFFRNNYIITEEKCLIQKNWIDIENYEYTDHNNDTLGILFLGWVEKDKGIFDLIQSIHDLKSHKNLLIHVAGYGKHFEESKTLIKKLNLTEKFIFHGWVDKNLKKQLLKECSVFVLPSYYEGMPNSLIESMSSGLACICSNVGGIPDIITNGINGYIHEPGDVEFITKKIKLLIENERILKSMQKQARKYAKNNLDIKIALENFNKIL